VVALNMVWEPLLIALFENGTVKNGDWPNSELPSTGSRREAPVSWMAEIIASLGGYFL
jgi:hypothetical protein